MRFKAKAHVQAYSEGSRLTLTPLKGVVSLLSPSWIDGTKEERVFSRTLDLNYPELCKDTHREEIEVPEALAESHNDLAWVTEGNYPLRQASDDPNRWNFDQVPGPFGRVYLPGEALPQVYIIPLSHWISRSTECLGPTWKPNDEHYILSKARELGWDDGDLI